MTRIIRSPKEFFEYYGVKQPWKQKGYRMFKEYHPKSNAIADSAFGDRLHWWKQSWLFAKKLDFKWILQFKQSDYPERHFFNFSQSMFLNDTDFYRGINHFEYLSDSLFDDIILNNVVIDDYDQLPKYIIMNRFPTQFNPIFDSICLSDLIKFKYPEMSEELKEVFGNYTAVHLRRFYGINYNDNDLSELPPVLREEYKKEVRFNDPVTWTYVKDKEYFDELEKFDGKFYVSTDLPGKYYFTQWKNRFPNRILNMYDVREKVISIVKHYYGEEFVDQQSTMIDRMIDYFALMHSKVIVAPQNVKSFNISSWAQTAHELSGTPLHKFITGKNR